MPGWIVLMLAVLWAPERTTAQIGVTIKPETLTPSVKDVELSCDVGPDFELLLLQWSYPGGKQLLKYTAADSSQTPNDPFVERLKDANFTDGVHSMKLTNVSVCDTGTFFCIGFTSSGASSGAASLTAYQMKLDDKLVESDMTLPGPAQVSVTCDAWWTSSDVNVSLSTGDMPSTEAIGGKQAQEGCTVYKTSAKLDIYIGVGSSQSFTCTAAYKDAPSVTRTYVISAEDDGSSSGAQEGAGTSSSASFAGFSGATYLLISLALIRIHILM